MLLPALGLALVTESHAVKVLDDRPITQFLRQTWAFGDDLPMGRITDIEISENGFLWVASFDGLFRFDGVTCELYSFDQEQTLIGGIQSLYEEADGTLWIGGNGGGLARLKNGVLRQWTHADGLESSAYFRLFHDWHGRVVVPGDRGLQTIIDNEVVDYPIEALHAYNLREVCFMSDRSIYLGLWEGGLVQLVPTAENSYEQRPISFPDGIEGIPRALAEGKQGGIWIGLDSGIVLKLDREGNFTQFALPGSPELDTTMRFEIDEDGVVWACYTQGVVRIRQDQLDYFPLDSTIDMSFTHDGALY